jgi:glycosyltransferase involved in cell wall biosynthesis
MAAGGLQKVQRKREQVLGVVNYEPITTYKKTGYSLKQLESYYNPAGYFDKVHIFACGDKNWNISEKVHVHPLYGKSLPIELQLIKYCIKYNVSVLRNFEAFNTHYLTADIKQVLRIPAVISLHDVLYPFTILDYDHILTYVEWLREAVISEYGVENVTLLLNRIDENLFKPGIFANVPARFLGFSHRIVSIGRLEENYKNYSNLIKAMVYVIKKYPGTALLIFGKGKDHKNYQDMIDKLGLSQSVYLMGLHPQEMLVEYLNWSDFFALCNPYGDLGKPLAEAMLVGKPVVATGGKGNSKNHLIDGFNAKQVHYLDIYKPDVIASAICFVIENKSAFNPQAIRERAKNEYSFEALSKLEASVYYEVLKNRWSFLPKIIRGKVGGRYFIHQLFSIPRKIFLSIYLLSVVTKKKIRLSI